MVDVALWMAIASIRGKLVRWVKALVGGLRSGQRGRNDGILVGNQQADVRGSAIFMITSSPETSRE